MSLKSELLIGGELVGTAEVFNVIDPATGKVFATAPKASRDHAEKAIRAAKSSQPRWAGATIEFRREKVLALADVLRDRASELADVLVREQGKPLAQAEAEISTGEAFIRHFAHQELPTRVLQGDAAHKVEVIHKPLGVVVVIDPWNFPLLTAAYGMALPLIAGNTVVLKPAPTTPLSPLLLGALVRDIFPPGVVNVITDTNDLGDFLTSHPDVAKVTFTGSIATGRKVMASAAPTLKRLTLELGGNDAAIVLHDADVEAAARQIYATAFYNCGQICLTIKRVYAHASIYDRFCEMLAAEAKRAVVGNGFDPKTTIGPVQNAMQYEKARRYLDIAHRDGNVIAGGTALGNEGYFIAPTIVRDIDDNSELVTEEQFAPILPVVRFDDIEVALACANRLPFGLGGSVWTSDIEFGRQLARRLEVGSAWVNQHLLWGPHVPMAGAKQSGIGSQFGDDGLLEYTQRQVVWSASDAPS